MARHLRWALPIATMLFAAGFSYQAFAQTASGGIAGATGVQQAPPSGLATKTAQPSEVDVGAASLTGLATPTIGSSLARLVDSVSHDDTGIDAEVECIAKIVHHEAANQSLLGQLAVAEVVVNRVTHGGAFPNTACAVANQPGQFFRVARYNARSDQRRWRVAVAIAKIAKAHQLPSVVPGALFFRAAYSHPAFGRGHAVIARVGDQVFYR